MNLKKLKITLFRSPGLIVPTIIFCQVFSFGPCLMGRTLDTQERTDAPNEGIDIMDGKHKTDLSINFNFIVEGSPDQIFRLWTTVSEMKKFFCTDAVVDLRQGGVYEIYFLSQDNPESDINSTKGARLLDIKKDEKLAFEWTMPPFAGEFNIIPLPTWVEITFQALKNNPKKTHISLTHYGFKSGSKWNEAYQFFVRNWSLILFRLDLFCASNFSK